MIKNFVSKTNALFTVKALLIFFLFIQVLSGSLFAQQEIGKPFIHNYSSQEYEASPQNWAIVQDKRGLMYFGNNDGVLEYDGNNWKLVKNTHNLTVRSLAITNDGTIYVGSVGEFGFLAPDSLGNLVYQSLIPALDPKLRNIFSDVWKIHITSNGIYFQAFECLIKLKNKEFSVWYPEKNAIEASFHFSFLVNNQLFIRENGKGLKQMLGDSLKLVAGGEKFAQEKIYTMLPYQDKKILVGTLNQGLFIYDSQSFEPFTTDADSFLFENRLYHASIIKNPISKEVFYIFGTLQGGIIIIDEKGKFYQIISKQQNKEIDLQDNSIFYTYIDRQQILWVGLNIGISKIELLTPLSRWDQSEGLEGSINAIQKIDGKLFVATNLGVYQLNRHRFEKVKGIKSSAWYLLQYKFANQKVLLVATDDGIYQIQAEKTLTEARKISNYNAFVLYESLKDPSKVYVGINNGIGIIGYQSGTWVDFGRIQNVEEEIRALAEDDMGNLWAGSEYDGLIKVSFSAENRLIPTNISRYGNQNSSIFNGIQIYPYRNKLLFITGKGLFRFDEKKDIFTPDLMLARKFTDTSGSLFFFSEDFLGNFWLNLRTEKKTWIELIRKKTDSDGNITYIQDSVSLKRMPSTDLSTLYPDSTGVMWASGLDVLYRYDDKIKKNYQQSFHALIRKVVIPTDSVIFNGTYFVENDQGQILPTASHVQPNSLKPSLDYEHNSLVFHYSSTYFENEKANLYSYYLEGYDTHWSEWTKENIKEYTNLPAKDYRFRLRAKNIYDTISIESVYEFRIKSPWYQTKWAFMIYFLLTVSAIWFFIRLNTRRLILQKQRLEDIVRERTSEISLQSTELKKQKEEIEIQKDLLEGKNKEITGEKDKTDQAYNNIKVLSEIGQKITATLSLDSIRDILYESISIWVDTSNFGIGIYDEKTRSIEFENYIEKGTKIPYKQCSIADESDLANFCFYNREDILINDYLEVYKKFVPNAPYPKRNAPQAMIYVPLIINEKVIGVLTVQSYQKNVYNSYQLSILKNLAVYVAIALQNSESYTEITEQKQIIEYKNHQIEHINKSLMDSINYASRIQSAMLPQIDKVRLTMPDSFILLKPRDIVSGDFYWFAETQIKNIRRTVVAALDCTGHGVPGAFMSMIGNELLNQIVTQENITEPNLILDILNKGVVAALKQEQTSNRDGMDGTICTVDWQSKTVEMAAANNPLVYIQKKEVIELRADKMPIGYVKGSKSANFSKTIIDVALPTYFYLFSDGYPDQFGGDENRKFMKKRLKELFLEIHEKNYQEQHEILDETIEKWKLGRKQTDDILVIGFKV